MSQRVRAPDGGTRTRSKASEPRLVEESMEESEKVDDDGKRKLRESHKSCFTNVTEDSPERKAPRKARLKAQELRGE